VLNTDANEKANVLNTDANEKANVLNTDANEKANILPKLLLFRQQARYERL
jgi:hypothetical protein